MSPITIDLINKALKLSIKERAEMIGLLSRSIEPQPPLHPAWEAEIARRIDAMDRGETVFVDGTVALRRIGEKARVARDGEKTTRRKTKSG